MAERHNHAMTERAGAARSHRRRPPVGPMAELGEGPVIAVDVEPNAERPQTSGRGAGSIADDARTVEFHQLDAAREAGRAAARVWLERGSVISVT